MSTHTTLDGITAITPTATGGVCTPLRTTAVQNGTFNAIRAGMVVLI
jgi:hypothetical protein